MLKSSISFFRKVFCSSMYFIRTETGTIVFEPPASSDDSSVTDTGEE